MGGAHSRSQDKLLLHVPNFTLTTVGEKRAAMYGGWDGSLCFNDLFIVELGRHSVVSVFTT